MKDKIMNENQNENPAPAAPEPTLAQKVFAVIKARCAAKPEGGWGIEDQMAVFDAIFLEATGEPTDGPNQPKGLNALVKQQCNASAFRQHLVAIKLQPDVAKKRSKAADPLAGLY